MWNQVKDNPFYKWSLICLLLFVVSLTTAGVLFAFGVALWIGFACFAFGNLVASHLLGSD